MTVTIVVGNCLEKLREMPADSVHACVSSPPYWGLRDYGVGATLWGCDPNCDHQWGPQVRKHNANAIQGPGSRGKNVDYAGFDRSKFTGPFCEKCGGWNGALGLEPTPEMFIEHLVQVYDEVYRVLRPDGTAWVNMGDCYATGAGSVGLHPGGGVQGAAWAGRPAPGATSGAGYRGGREGVEGKHRTKKAGSNRAQRGDGKARGVPFGPMTQPNRMPLTGFKPKDMVGIPWALAVALRAPRYLGKIKSERDRVWLAAIMDGEGSISGYTQDKETSGRDRQGLNICITNSSIDLLDECDRIWPASRRDHTPNGQGHLGVRDVFRWIPGGAANKAEVLAEIFPYLVAKKKQAIVAWNLAQASLTAKRDGQLPAAPAAKEKRETMVQMLRDLNAGKAVDLPAWLRPIPSLYRTGWYLRQEIIWNKPNPMPESIEDRCTKAHEHVFLLAKSERYFYDAEAIKEVASENTNPRVAADGRGRLGVTPKSAADDTNVRAKESWHASTTAVVSSRNKRTVWTVATQPFKEAHFATFPPALIEPCVKAGTSHRGCCPTCRAPWERVSAPTERYLKFLGRSYHDHADDDGAGMMQHRGENRQNALRKDGGIIGKETETIGWYPTCACDGLERLPPVPPSPRIAAPDDAGEDWEPSDADKAELELRRTAWRVECAKVYARWREMCRPAERMKTIPAVVLDPFGGAGTTGLVADRLGRDGHLIELSEAYAEMARKRIDGKSMPLFATAAE